MKFKELETGVSRYSEQYPDINIPATTGSIYFKPDIIKSEEDKINLKLEWQCISHLDEVYHTMMSIKTYEIIEQYIPPDMEELKLVVKKSLDYLYSDLVKHEPRMVDHYKKINAVTINAYTKQAYERLEPLFEFK